MYNEYDEANPDLEQDMYIKDLLEDIEDEDDDESVIYDDDEEEEAIPVDENLVTSDSDFEYETIDAELGTKKKKKKKNVIKADDAEDVSTKRGHVVSVSLSERYMQKQLAFKYENYRDRFKFKYNGGLYIGKVVSQLPNGKYIIDHVSYDTSMNKPTLKAFSLSEIKKAQ